MFRRASLLAAIVLLCLVVYSPVSATITGLVVKEAGVPVAEVDGLTVSGELAVFEGEISPELEIFWVDNVLGEIQPTGSGDSLGWTIGDESLAVLNRVGTWTFTLQSVGEHGPTNVVFRLYIGAALDYTSPSIPLHVESPHAEAEGVVIRKSGEILVTIWEGVVTGRLQVLRNDSLDIDIHFLDPDSNEFQIPDEEMWLQLPIADTSLAVADTTFRDNVILHGKVAGNTSLEVELWHIDHVDFLSPVIPVRILKKGDADGIGSLNISDVVRIINYIFAGAAAPQPLLSGDADCNGSINISDAVRLINYIFAGGLAPC